MSTSDKDQAGGGGEESGTGAGTSAASQSEPGASERGARHGRGRRGRTGRHEQGRPQPSQQQHSRRPDSTVNLEELRELTELFTAHGLTDFEFENADVRIRLSRNPAPSAVGAQASAPPATHVTLSAAQQATAQSAASQAAAAAAAEGSATPAAATAAPAEEPEEELHVITSPIVGTFYRAPSPTAESFVKVGSQVEVGSIVCIIEAMKLMNEIESDGAGTIAKIYVENGQPVEYGQPLFGVKK